MALYINGVQTGGGEEAIVTVYHGTPNLTYVQNDQGTECTLTKIETSTYIMYQLNLNIHIVSGGIPNQEYAPLYSFNSGELDDLDWVRYLIYDVPSANTFNFGRVKFTGSNPDSASFTANTIGAYWSAFTGNGWYSNTPMIYIVPKN